MSSSAGGKPPSGSSPGSPAAAARPPADTPHRLVVRSHDSNPGTDSMIGANDTAVAMAAESSAVSSTVAADRASGSSPAIRTDIVGTTLAGRYLITRQVGQGGMGAVYEATHTLIGKRVAVKVLLEKYAKREAIVQRLEQEAKLASSVGNEHIIDITDFGQTEDGRTFVVMEYLEGESLAECLAREPQLPEQRILRMAAQAATALAAAHEKGVVHRDIKPENLFLLQRKQGDYVKILDFGISKSLRATGDDETEQPRLTQTGMVLGTPLYMSPEQARGDEDLDHRVDVYALGVIMYEASTGRVPFIGTNYLSVISQVLNDEPPAPRDLRHELSEEFEAIVQRAMAKSRDDRYPSARDLANDLSALLDDPSRSTERAKITGPRKKAAVAAAQRKGGLRILGWVAGVAVLVAAIVVTVTVAMSGDHAPEDHGVGSGSNLAVKPPPPPVPADAAAPPVDAALATYHIETVPPGAMISRDGDERGRSPWDETIVDENKDVKFTAELDGYEPRDFTLNPIEDDKSTSTSKWNRVIKLRKLAKNAPPQTPHTVPHIGNGSATPAKGSNAVPRGDGSMQGNPILNDK